jgi:hypothetical protein
MKARRIRWPVLYLVLSLIVVLALIAFNNWNVPRSRNANLAANIAKTGFVTHSRSQLMFNGQPFRFAGANMHWLPFGDSTTYTSQFEINDGLDAAKEMGLTVVRSHNLGISTGCSNCIEPALGVFNETALVHDDYVIKAARDRGIRLIIPLTDNYHYPAGGKHNFTDWRGISDENQFYYNAQVITDFETYISTLLNHVNVYTGLAYKNDPTIMVWETGNELFPPTSWTQTISTYIKSIDRNHLVLDGRYAIDPNAASLTNVDMVSDHYYPKSIARLISDANGAKNVGKAFVVGEFDWNDTNGGNSLNSFLSAIESNSAVAGDLFWELWSHADEYGYVQGEVQYMLHYPGDSTAMRASTRQLRIHAYKMRGLSVPPDSTPGVPLLEVVIREGTENVLVWRGTAIAASYTVERATVSANGPWTITCDQCATDNNTPWIDPTPAAGPLWYRVIAYNLSGVAGNPSNSYQAGSGSILVDNLNNWNKVYQHSDNLYFDTTHVHFLHGDTSRATRITTTHEYVTWKQPDMISFQAITYFWPYEPVSHFTIYTSADGRNWMVTKPEITDIGGNWLEYIYTLNDMSGVSYVKMIWNNTTGWPWNPNLGEVTISYS